MFIRRYLIVVGLALLLNAPGSVKAEPPGQNITPPAPQAASQANKEQQPPQAVKNYTKAEKQTYQKKTAQALQEMQQKIGDLKLKSRTVPHQQKRMVLRALVDVERRYIYAKQKLAALEAAPEKTWSSLKNEMDKSLVDLNQAVKALEAHL